MKVHRVTRAAKQGRYWIRGLGVAAYVLIMEFVALGAPPASLEELWFPALKAAGAFLTSMGVTAATSAEVRGDNQS